MYFSRASIFGEYDKIAYPQKFSLPIKCREIVIKQWGNAATFLHSKIAKFRCSKNIVFYS